MIRERAKLLKKDVNISNFTDEPSRSDTGDFLKGNYIEDADHNQYWYSPFTIKTIVDEVESLASKVAFISTPSLYFSVSDKLKANSRVFDFDRKWEYDSGYVFYDFNQPIEIPSIYLKAFDFVIIDPPFITEEVWAKYAETANLLLTPDSGKIICTTIQENEVFLKKLLNVSPAIFQPCIPNLVYQYSLFTNYKSDIFSKINPEIAI